MMPGAVWAGLVQKTTRRRAPQKRNERAPYFIRAETAPKMRHLRDAGEWGAHPREMAATLRITEACVRQALYRMRDKKMARRLEGDRWVLTEAGRIELAVYDRLNRVPMP